VESLTSCSPIGLHGVCLFFFFYFFFGGEQLNLFTILLILSANWGAVEGADAWLPSVTGAQDLTVDAQLSVNNSDMGRAVLVWGQSAKC
jgi:hypothetical protein